VEKLRDKLREEEYAHRTINWILWIVGAVFRLAIKRGQYSKDPVDSVERAVQPARELSTVNGSFTAFPRLLSEASFHIAQSEADVFAKPDAWYLTESFFGAYPRLR